jgi:hypothetical protein
MNNLETKLAELEDRVRRLETKAIQTDAKSTSLEVCHKCRQLNYISNMTYKCNATYAYVCSGCV